ncbi:hypothetical protein B1987_20295 [Mycobacterium kansasii]|nr:hypothetical protein B1987_20295 [Mycobacterium kansasii]
MIGTTAPPPKGENHPTQPDGWCKSVRSRARHRLHRPVAHRRTPQACADSPLGFLVRLQELAHVDVALDRGPSGRGY